jgi:hypothetical protein
MSAPDPNDGLAFVLPKLQWMRERRIWPNGSRYLWTDAFGVVLLVSLFRALGQERFLDAARNLVAEVERVLGQARGLRIGEARDQSGQYFHYLAMWLYALGRLGTIDVQYRRRGVELVNAVHDSFLMPNRGIWWKMSDELQRPEERWGFGPLDPALGLVTYRLLDEDALARQIAQLSDLVERDLPARIQHELGFGLMLWLTHFCPAEPWARGQRERSLAGLDALWIEPGGYFCRSAHNRRQKIAFANYGASLGLQATRSHEDRVARLHAFFEGSEAQNDRWHDEAITHVMACVAHFPGDFLIKGT